MKTNTTITLLVLSIFFICGCQPEKFDVKYVVESDVYALHARIVFQNANGAEETLSDTVLPWIYTFQAEEGDVVKITANTFSAGNSNITPFDSFSVAIFVNGGKFRESKGAVQKSNAETIIVSGTL